MASNLVILFLLLLLDGTREAKQLLWLLYATHFRASRVTNKPPLRMSNSSSYSLFLPLSTSPFLPPSLLSFSLSVFSLFNFFLSHRSASSTLASPLSFSSLCLLSLPLFLSSLYKVKLESGTATGFFVPCPG